MFHIGHGKHSRRKKPPTCRTDHSCPCIFMCIHNLIIKSLLLHTNCHNYIKYQSKLNKVIDGSPQHLVGDLAGVREAAKMNKAQTYWQCHLVLPEAEKTLAALHCSPKSLIMWKVSRHSGKFTDTLKKCLKTLECVSILWRVLKSLESF